MHSYVSDALDSYLTHGLHPGTFMYHMLCFNFDKATQHADAFSIKNVHSPERLEDFINAIKRRCPPEAYGSKSTVDRWMKSPSVREPYLFDYAVSTKLAGGGPPEYV